MQEIDSCQYVVMNGKSYMNIYRNGEKETEEAFPRPYIFVPTKFQVNTQAQVMSTDLQALDTNESVRQYFFKSPQDVKFFRTINEKRGVTTYEGDVRYNVRWMMDNKVLCSNYENWAAFDTEQYIGNHRPDPKSGQEIITAIGITFKGETYTWAGPEREILIELVTFIKENHITLMMGWNSREWDNPILKNSLYRHNIQFDWNSVRWMDAMNLYKYTKGKSKASRYSLEYLGEEVLHKDKPYVGRNMDTLSELEKKERVGWDSQTTYELIEHFHLRALGITLAKMSYRLPDDLLGVNEELKRVTVTPLLDNLFLMQARVIGSVLQNKHETGGHYEGAYIYIYEGGAFRQVAQFDINSMYPNILLAYKLAPYGRFDLIGPIVQRMLDGKAQSAKESSEYWAYKIQANALYGLMASKHYRFDAKEVASEITRHGREILKGIMGYVNGMGYRVLYMDTDSTFVQINRPEDSVFLQGAINKYIETAFEVPNIKTKSEGIWDYIEFPRGAGGEKIKKRYFGRKDGKLEITGLESVRGDWSQLAKEMVKKICYMKAFDSGKEAVRLYVDGEVQKMFSGVYDRKLILAKSMSKEVTQYGGMKIDKSGKQRRMPIPPHVRAYRDALRGGEIPTETVQYGTVNYIMCRGGIPRLANLVKTGDIDHGWFYQKQIQPVLYRLGVDDVLKTKKNIEKDISVLQGDQATL